MQGASLTSWTGVASEMSEVALLLLGELGDEDEGVYPLEGVLHVAHALLLGEKALVLLRHEQVESEGKIDSTSSRLGSPSLFIILLQGRVW